MMADTSLGTRVTSCSGGTIGSYACFVINSTAVLASNGGRPVTSTYSVQPSE